MKTIKGNVIDAQRKIEAKRFVRELTQDYIQQKSQERVVAWSICLSSVAVGILLALWMV